MRRRRGGLGRAFGGAGALCGGALCALTWAGGAWAGPDRIAAVLPPERPAGLGLARDVDATGSVGPVAPGRGTGGTAEPSPILRVAAEDAPALGEKAVVERANATLNAVRSMSADFTQIGGDGRRSSGTLYLQRPGKLRFEYDKPSTLEIVSDGSTVLVRDRKLNTADPYPIGQTPLKFLLNPRIDLGRQTTVTGVSTTGEGVRVAIEDGSTLGGTSRITLTFDREVKELRGWRVVDPQGYTTTVSLSGIEQNRAIDPKTFMLNYSRPVQ